MAFKITKRSKVALLILIPLIIIYYTLGIFVIPPSGVVPDGASVVYYRMGLKVSFITSADGIQLGRGMDVSIFSRMMVTTEFGQHLQKRKIVSLPYSERLYLISTGGKKF